MDKCPKPKHGVTAEFEVGTTLPVDHAPRLADFAGDAVGRGVHLTVRGSTDAIEAWCWLLSPHDPAPKPSPPATLRLVAPTDDGGGAA